ncbi:MAG: alpha/beta hydrolase [Deltaproteobacteria bacterium]|nr:alpha/beta hydrolase [Deltaproteobacteria bacterium]MBW2445292.1 alpha/beta hydrolase [Deltaproteobacteria bacterium]
MSAEVGGDTVRKLQNGRVTLALHQRKAGEGTPLLLLHELYGSSAGWATEVDAWPGPVFALDFCGHGESAWMRGGSYHIEHFLSDADTALREVGSAVLAGAGLGAWYGLMLAGARAEQVPGSLLLPGRGLEGSGSQPDPLDTERRIPTEAQAAAFDEGDCDPCCAGMEGDPRPPDFIEPFATAARNVLLVDDGRAMPHWWRTVQDCGGQKVGADLVSGLARLQAAV